MDLRHLKYFVTLAEELNFHRAAERLHISQPPLSRQIRQLEEELGTPLFSRGARGVELTQAGHTLREEAQRIIGMVAIACERTGKAGRGQIGRLDVGIFGSAILYHIPRLLMQFRNRYPEVEIALHQLPRAEQIVGLRERRLTVGISRRVPEEPDIVVETMFQEPLVIALNRAHPLARRKAIRIAEIVHEPLILYPSKIRPGLVEDVMVLMDREGARPRIVQEVTDVVTAIALVASGFGVCVTPKAASSLRLPGVIYRPIKAAPPPCIELSCLYRRGDASPILAAFLDITRRYRPASVG